MSRPENSSRGFALIASLLLLVLMSGIAIGLLMLVNTEASVDGHDLQNSKSYRSAEGAIEKMTSDLANTFQAVQAPSAVSISSLSNFPPTNDPSVSYPTYQIVPATDANGKLLTTFGRISSGNNSGLFAQIIPITLNVTAQRGLGNGQNSVVGFGDQVSMTRTVEIALIPVFQFGVFSDSDLAFFSSPNLDFAGRVHTNGDLFLGVSNGATLAFHDKITAYGNVIRKTIPNGLVASGSNDTGTVDIPQASQGCDNTQPACRAIAATEGSADNPTANQNPGWPNTSVGVYQSWITDGNYGQPGGTGVTQLALSFVAPGSGQSTAAQNVQIIRRPPALEALSSALAQARLANQGQIRVLLSDTQNDLHLLDWNGDPAQDVNLGACIPAPYTVNGVANNYFAYANTNPATDAGNWEPQAGVITPAGTTPNGYWVPQSNCPSLATGQWPLIPGWLLVEVKQNNGAWLGVTQEWLKLGFARGLQVPNSSAGVVNSLPDHRKAILYFQMLADRNGDGVITNGQIVARNNAYNRAPFTTGIPSLSENPNEAGSPYNWYPINIYDAREGENWDVQPGNNTCTPNGVMNLVELDVGNLRNWITNTANGQSIDSAPENGYILYFSDRRGMQPIAAGQPLIGEYGFEDTINSGNTGKPDGRLEPALATPRGKARPNPSPEDVNDNGTLETYGVKHVGDAFGAQYATDTNNTNPPTPYAPGHRMACFQLGRENAVTGTRHGLKLVNGSLGNLPTRPDGTGGFTVGSENPVYVYGDYNSSAADPTWANVNAAEPNHAAAAVIADAVTLLSSNWQDSGYPNKAGGALNGSMSIPATTTQGGGNDKAARTTYYRMAVAAGKTLAFSNLGGAPTIYYGTDGGVHNFLRFLEDWSNQTLFYKGSLVSLYPSMYATGTFKCCNTVYNPPVRNYRFDPLFAQPQNLPPGTPTFKDVDNLSYRQNFTARTN